MIKQNQKLFNALNLISDCVINYLSLIAAYYLRFGIRTSERATQSISAYLIVGGVYMLVIGFAYCVADIYKPIRRTRFKEVASRIAVCDLMGALCLGFIMYAVRMVDFSRLLLLYHLALSTVGVCAKHFLLRRLLSHYRKQGKNLRHVLLIGSGHLAAEYAKEVGGMPEFGYHVLGYVSDHTNEALSNRLGGISDITSVIKSCKADEAVIALDSSEENRISTVILACEKEGLRFSVIPYFNEYIISLPSVQTIGRVKLLDVSGSPLDGLVAKAYKRAEDVIGALFALALSSPIILVAAAGTLISDGFPIIFKQKRVGRNQKEFEMYKFRTMRKNDSSNTAWSTKSDDRRTAFGKILRKTSVDELPQLVNVLKGEMSLIGPRPEIPHYVSDFKESVPYYMIRHQIKPGMTGWAQVNGLRGDTSIPKRVEYDIYYIDNWSPLLDLRILLKTVFGGIVNDESIK